jgi:hypothetical protein
MIITQKGKKKKKKKNRKDRRRRRRRRRSWYWLPKGNLQAKKHEAQSLTLHLTSLGIVHGVHIFVSSFSLWCLFWCCKTV